MARLARSFAKKCSKKDLTSTTEELISNWQLESLWYLMDKLCQLLVKFLKHIKKLTKSNKLAKRIWIFKFLSLYYMAKNFVSCDRNPMRSDRQLSCSRNPRQCLGSAWISFLCLRLPFGKKVRFMPITENFPAGETIGIACIRSEGPLCRSRGTLIEATQTSSLSPTWVPKKLHMTEFFARPK